MICDRPDWRSHFNFSAQGFRYSFLAIMLSWPLYLICAIAASRNSDQDTLISSAKFTLIIIAMTAAFPLIAYVICQLMSRMSVFGDWVITRNWTMLAVIAIMSAGFGLYLFGLLPFSAAYSLGISAYLGTLLADICVAQRAAHMDWFASIFTACGIALASLLVLLGGFALAG